MLTLNVKRNPNLKAKAALQNIDNPKLFIGVLKGSKDKEGKFIAERAFYNEYGTDHIPSRPAIRLTFAEKSKEWNRLVTNFVKNGYTTQGVMRRAFEVLGQLARGDISRKIGSNIPPVLAESTLKAKTNRLKSKGGYVSDDAIANRSKTLIDTGEYQKSIDYTVD